MTMRYCDRIHHLFIDWGARMALIPPFIFAAIFVAEMAWLLREGG